MSIGGSQPRKKKPKWQKKHRQAISLAAEEHFTPQPHAPEHGESAIPGADASEPQAQDSSSANISHYHQHYLPLFSCVEGHPTSSSCPAPFTALPGTNNNKYSGKTRRKASLLALNDTLEQRVAERTAALARVNEALQATIVEHKRTEAALDQLRQQNEMILNSAGEGIFGIDVHGKATFVNPAAARMLGYKVSELLGQFLHDILHYQKADGTPYPATECPLLHTLHGGIVNRVTEEVYWCKDGTNFPVEYITTPIRNEQNEVIGAVVIFQDITQRKEVERIKNEVLSMVSHEIRTPLSSLRGFTELLLNRTFPLEKQREFLQVIHSESVRLSQLLDDFVALQRSEEGRLPCSFTSVALEPLLRESAALFTKQGGEHSLHLEISPALSPVRADADRLRQVLANLLSNAIKFSPRGGSIIVGARQEGHLIITWITDHGVGIPQTAIPKLFTKFFRVDNSDTRNIGGTGLGLALVREIITAHQGKIWVESTLGVGSTFFFSLPVASS